MIFCSLYSGSSGNSIFVGNEKTKILIDAGVPGKKIDEALAKIDQNPREIDGIFITMNIQIILRVWESYQENMIFLYMQMKKHGKLWRNL